MTHEALRKQYAADAAITNRPWEWWEVEINGEWRRQIGHPMWFPDHRYRRKDIKALKGIYVVSFEDGGIHGPFDSWEDAEAVANELRAVVKELVIHG